MLEEAIASARAQGIIERAPTLEELFPSNTHSLVA